MKQNFPKTFTAIALLLLIAAFNFPMQAQIIQKAYDLGSDDYINMSVVNGAGEIYSVGSSNHAGAGDYDAILTKFSATGTFQWEKQYGTAGTEFGTAIAATTSGSGYAIAGRTGTGNSFDILLVKTDNNGNRIWAKNYGTSSTTEYGLSLIGTIDNGYAVTGQTTAGNGASDLFILKVDSTGAVQFFNAYGSTGNEGGSQIVQDPSDSGFVAIGYSGLGGAGYNDAYLVKLDATGGFGGEVLLGGTGDESAKRMMFLPGNKVLITGTYRPQPTNSQDDVFVTMVDFNSFSVVWSNTFGSPAGNDAPTNVVALPGLGFAFSVNTASFGGDKGMIFAVDTNGNVQGGGLLYNGPGSFYFQDILFTGSSVLITGFANGFGTASDLYLIAFPGDPKNTCLHQDVALAQNAITVGLVGPTIPTHNPVAITNSVPAATFTDASATATEFDVCANLPLVAYAGDDQAVCGTGSARIGGNPSAEGGTPFTNGNSPYTYSWTPTAGLDNPNDPNPLASAGTYVLTVTDSLGATATDTVTVSIGSGPAASINPPGPNICFGQNVSLTASGGVSYLWNTGDSTAQIVKNPTLAVTGYSVTVTDANGCTAVATDTVVMHDYPNVAVNPTSTTICDNATTGVTLTATGAETYVWTPSTGLSDDSIAAPVALPTSTITYTVTGKNGHCTGPNATATVTVTVTGAPTVTVTPGDTTICDTTSVTLVASGASTYAWSPATGLSSTTASSPVASPTTDITYTVTGSNNCGSSAPVTVTVNVDICDGIFDIPQSFTSIFPNPATDKVNITFDARSASAGVLSIIGVDGKIAFEQNIGVSHGINNLTVNTASLPSGLYFVKIKTSDVTAVAKVIIE